jgi:hypothetical protein
VWRAWKSLCRIALPIQRWTGTRGEAKRRGGYKDQVLHPIFSSTIECTVSSGNAVNASDDQILQIKLNTFNITDLRPKTKQFFIER